MKVLKFGGSSRGGRRAHQERHGHHLREAAREDRVAVVLSAMKGVTDLLIAAARKAEEGIGRFQARSWRRSARGTSTRCASCFGAGGPGRRAHSPGHHVQRAGRDPARRGADPGMLGAHHGPRHELRREAVLPAGRRLHARAAAWTRCWWTRGRSSSPTTASAPPRWTSTGATRASRSDFQRSRGIPVIPGFIGATDEGRHHHPRAGTAPTTPPPSSAPGAQAEVIEIWTDVDGVLSADPRIVPEAFVIPEISYEEAMELSYFGAKVIHPYTMVPAVEKDIPLLIKNSLNPAAPGTLIAAGDAGASVGRARGGRPSHRHRLHRGNLPGEHRGRRHDGHSRFRRADILRACARRRSTSS